MQADIVRFLAEAGPQATWVLVFFAAAVVAVFVLLLVLVTCVTLFTRDPEQRKIGYQLFRALLKALGRGGRDR